jgi:hypothetical protein
MLTFQNVQLRYDTIGIYFEQTSPIFTNNLNVFDVVALDSVDIGIEMTGYSWKNSFRSCTVGNVVQYGVLMETTLGGTSSGNVFDNFWFESTTGIAAVKDDIISGVVYPSGNTFNDCIFIFFATSLEIAGNQNVFNDNIFYSDTGINVTGDMNYFFENHRESSLVVVNTTDGGWNNRFVANDFYVTESAGVDVITSSDTVSFSHLMVGMPGYVGVSFNCSGYGEWWWGANTTTINIYVQNSGNYTIYWWATIYSGPYTY